MTDNPSSVLPPNYVISGACPIIYFDHAPTFGTLAGIVLIELTARALLPSQAGGVIVETAEVARLRCSPIAAKSLRDALDAALKMLEKPQAEFASSPDTLN
jgi:hypothetical protein